MISIAHLKINSNNLKRIEWTEYQILNVPNVSPTASSPLRFLILFRDKDKIFKFFKPFRLPSFSIQFVDKDNLTHDASVSRLKIVFS